MRRVRSNTGLPITSRGGSSIGGALDKSARGGVIGALLMVVGLVFAVYTIATVSHLQDQTRASDGHFIGTGEGEGLELLEWGSHSKPAAAHGIHTADVHQVIRSAAASRGQPNPGNRAQAAQHAAQGSQPANAAESVKQHSAADAARHGPVIPDPQDAVGHVEHHSPAFAPADSTQHPSATGFYALNAKDAYGKERPFSEFAGRVTLVVNVASQCGFTDSNCKGLNEIHDKYAAHGLTILAFPCNQFGKQEPGTMPEIIEFYRSRYNIPYLLMEKVDVNGPSAHSVYKYLRRELPVSQGGGGGIAEGAELGWNFQKILVDRTGRPVRLHHQDFDRGQLEHDIYDLLVGKELHRR